MLETGWVSALLGGVLIGISASLLWLLDGKVAGISGIVASLTLPAPPARSYRWQFWFVLGLWGGGLALALWWPQSLGSIPASWPLLLGAGLCVGVGTRLSGGCTSGHGVCGISRGALRSIVATLLFMSSGALAAWLTRQLFGAHS